MKRLKVLGMLFYVLCSESQINHERRKKLEEILLKLFKSHLENAEKSYWKEIEKYGLTDFLWDEIKKEYGYSKEDHSPDALLIYLFKESFALLFQSCCS